ncbi:YxeA family protein [Lysinibacillus sp. MHQ-1]|nr:YxeA family protein [Lysinibacillus sp. MHQ-1]
MAKKKTLKFSAHKNLRHDAYLKLYVKKRDGSHFL